MTDEITQLIPEPIIVENLSTKLKDQQKTLENLTNVLQNMATALNDVRQKTESSQIMLSALFKTIADGRPLVAEQLKESHHQITSDKVHKIFNNAVENKMIAPFDKVSSAAIVVVSEFDANGVELHRAAEFSMANIDVEIKNLFLDKVVGDRVALFKEGQLQNTYVVQSIYTPLDKGEKDLTNAETGNS